jgi:hypothetical protein
VIRRASILVVVVAAVGGLSLLASPTGAASPARPAFTLAPSSTDSDGDGLSNAWEKHWGITDPHRADSDGNGVPDGAEDPDGDGLSNLGEQRVHTDPTNPDTDGDGIPDALDDANGNGKPDGLEQDRRPIPSHVSPSLADAENDTPVSYRDGCHTGPGSSAIHPCAFGDTNSRVTIALFGDSHALQWEPPLDHAGRLAHWRLIMLTKSGCPSVDVRFRPGAFPDDTVPCEHWRANAIAWLNAHPPNLVIVSNSRGYTIVDAHGDKVPREPAWGLGLRRTLGELPSGTARMVIGDTVHLKREPVSCLHQYPDDIQPCDSPRLHSWSYSHDRTESEAAAAKHATFFSPNHQVCPYDPCPVVMGHFMMWRNATHLTATFAKSLWPTFESVVNTALAGTTAGASAQAQAAEWPPGR